MPRRDRDMKVVRTALAAALLCCATAPAAVTAEQPGYNIWFAGEVVSVDAMHGTVHIARGPTETSPPAIETCTILRQPLQRLRAGMEVEAQADTRRRPWRILHLRIFNIKAVRRPLPEIA